MQSVLEALVSATPLRMVNPRGQTLLTKREDEVVNLVVDGLSNRETAQKLGLTEHTVSNYLSGFMKSLESRLASNWFSTPSGRSNKDKLREPTIRPA
jgi:DNA-binding CsgD family transcriptional regulator